MPYLLQHLQCLQSPLLVLVGRVGEQEQHVALQA